MAFLRLFKRKKDPELKTISYGDTVQSLYRQMTWMQRLKIIEGMMSCARDIQDPTDKKKRIIGPCEKMGPSECSKCMHLDASTEMLKNDLLISQSHGEIGEKYPITAKNQRAWQKLWEIYLDDYAYLGPTHPEVKRLGRKLKITAFSFAMRSTRKEHTRIDVAGPEAMMPFLNMFVQQMNKGGGGFFDPSRGKGSGTGKYDPTKKTIVTEIKQT